MGENADDLVDGTVCHWCGMFFKKKDKPDQLYTHGYPVICWTCWGKLDKKERKKTVRMGLQRALVPTL